LTLSQQVSGASGRSGASQRTAAIVDVSQRFTYKLRGSLSAGYYFNKIDRSSNQTEDDEEETFRLGGSLRYDFTKDAYVEGGYRFTHIDDKDEDKTKERNAVFVQLGIQHDLLN
jgi:opacity protein-like surface antigen